MKVKSVAAILVSIGLSGAVLSACAQVPPPPEQDVSAGRHPHLAAAQAHIQSAYNELRAAQAANEYQLGGHADSAERLLDQASYEVKQAARAANAR